MTLLGDVFICMVETNNSNTDNSYKEIFVDLVPRWIWALEYIPWLWAVFGSILVGLTGVLPLLVVPIGQTDTLKQEG